MGILKRKGGRDPALALLRKIGKRAGEVKSGDAGLRVRAKRELRAFFKGQRIPATEIKMYGGQHPDFVKTASHYHEIYAAMLKHLKTLPGKEILHIASTHGAFMRFLQTKGAMAHALDINMDALRIGAERGLKKPVAADAGRVPFAENSFDCLVAENFLDPSYIKYEKIPGILREAYRVLEPGGLFINRDRGFSPYEDLPELYTACGFEVVEFDNDRKLLVLRKPGRQKQRK